MVHKDDSLIIIIILRRRFFPKLNSAIVVIGVPCELLCLGLH